MEFVQKIYDFILYLVNTIKGLVSSLKGEEEPTKAPIVDDTDNENA